MRSKRHFLQFLLCLLLLPLFCIPALAAEGALFRYELSVDGCDTVEVNTGDVITVTLYLCHTDGTPYTMHAMQDEIRYDADFFRLVENSALLSTGIRSTDIALVDGYREFYMNFLSFSGGEQWAEKQRIGSFQLEITGSSGVSTITNEDFLVSFPDGSGSYACEANELTIILSSECTVRFETNGGSSIDPVTAIYGELLTRPEDPVRPGKHLEGWYKDIHLTEEWDFSTDTVKGNMTLYARWADGEAVEEASYIFCGRPSAGIPGVPLCWLCLWLLLLVLATVCVFIFRRIRKRR